MNTASCTNHPIHFLCKIGIFCCFITFNCLLVSAQGPDFAWAKHIGNGSNLGATSLMLDKNDNIYISGYYLSDVNLGNGVSLTYTSFSSNYFIAKFTPGGTALWAKKVPVRGGEIDQLLVEENGDIYITGQYGASYLQGGGGLQVGTITLPAPTSSEGAYCLLKFNTDGDILWARTFDPKGFALNYSSITGVYLLPDNTVGVTGLFNTDLVFEDSYTLSNNGPATEPSAFLIQFSGNGQRLMAQNIGSLRYTYNTSTDKELFNVDKNGNIYRYSTAKNILKKYNSRGVEIQSKTLQVSQTVNGRKINVMQADVAGNVFIGGSFYNSPLSIENITIPSYGSVNNGDAFFVKLSSTDFSLLWKYQYEYSGCDAYHKFRCDELGYVYTIGQYSNCFSDSKALIQKLSPDGNLVWEKVIQGTQASPSSPMPVVNNTEIRNANKGGNIIVMGSFKENVQLAPSSSFTSSPSGNYNVYIAQYGICDTQKPVVTEGSSVNICDGDTTELSTAFTNVNYTYKWNTNETTENISVADAGSYYVIAEENNGCYALSDLVRVTVHDIPVNTVIKTSNTLKAEAENVDYQWIDCATNLPINGMTGQSYTPERSGTYKVVVQNDAGCSDTSSCIIVETDLSSFFPAQQPLLIYPNPAKDFIYIRSETPVKEIKIINLPGQLISRYQEADPIDIRNLSPGNYIISVETPGGIHREMIRKD